MMMEIRRSPERVGTGPCDRIGDVTVSIDAAPQLPPTRPENGISGVRLAAGITVIVLTVVATALFALGLWNPWRLVFLLQHFNNPWAGLLTLGVGSFLAVWLLAPVKAESRQPWRIRFRVLTAVVAVAGLVTTGLFHLWYRYEVTVLDRSDDGTRTVALVVVGGLAERELMVFDGAGLAAREVGSFGRPCNRVRAWFSEDRNVVIVEQGFGEWEFHLDPDTGVPRHRFGPRCSTGPVPATLEP